MPVSVDVRGGLIVTPSPETQGLAGRTFKRREPRGDAGDVVLVVGVTDVGGSGGPLAELVVTSATFGAVPAGWDAPTITYDMEQFAENYTETNAAELAALALAAAAAGKVATKASEGKDSPWRRT